jgi:hypothetical protein
VSSSHLYWCKEKLRETEPNLNYFRPLLQERFKTVVVGDAKILHHSRGGTEKVKTLRNQCAVVILTLMLAVSAYAGQIQGPGAVSGTGTTTTLTDVITTVIVTITTVIP